VLKLLRGQKVVDRGACGNPNGVVDRGADVAARYERTRETMVRIKVSAELRQLDKAIMLLVKNIRTEMPAPESLVTVKARRAAQARWDKARAQAWCSIAAT
jgi:hypothetical protein